STDRFARLTPTRSDSWVSVMFRCVRRPSMWQATRGSPTSTSDHSFELVLHLAAAADRPAEQLREDHGADPEVGHVQRHAVAHGCVLEAEVADDEVVCRHLGDGVDD